jgi:putative transposase
MTLFKNKYRIESIRLPDYDYCSNGYYFVTICTYQNEYFFGDIINSQFKLSRIGEIANKFWLEIPQHSKNTYVDTHVIMPNHMHGIIIIDSPTRRDVTDPTRRDVTDPTRRDVTCNVSTADNASNSVQCYNECDISRVMSEISPKAGSLSVILRSYKSAVKRWCQMNGYPGFAWQERFYEHVIRDESSLCNIREYIKNNPVKWEYQKSNPTGLWM